METLNKTLLLQSRPGVESQKAKWQMQVQYRWFNHLHVVRNSDASNMTTKIGHAWCARIRSRKAEATWSRRRSPWIETLISLFLPIQQMSADKVRISNISTNLTRLNMFQRCIYYKMQTMKLLSLGTFKTIFSSLSTAQFSLSCWNSNMRPEALEYVPSEQTLQDAELSSPATRTRKKIKVNNLCMKLYERSRRGYQFHLSRFQKYIKGKLTKKKPLKK